MKSLIVFAFLALASADVSHLSSDYLPPNEKISQSAPVVEVHSAPAFHGLYSAPAVSFSAPGVHNSYVAPAFKTLYSAPAVSYSAPAVQSSYVAPAVTTSYIPPATNYGALVSSGFNGGYGSGFESGLVGGAYNGGFNGGFDGGIVGGNTYAQESSIDTVYGRNGGYVYKH